MYGFISYEEHAERIGDHSTAAKQARLRGALWDTRRSCECSRDQAYRRVKEDEAVWIGLDNDRDRDEWLSKLGNSLSCCTAMLRIPDCDTRCCSKSKQ